jgi:hypothetical protein
MLNVRRRVAAAALLALSVSIARAEEATTRPAKAYGPNDVTAYVALDLDALTKSKALAALVPDAAQEIQSARAEIRNALKEQLGQDVGDIWISSVNAMIFGNDSHEAAVVLRGTWTPDQVAAILKAVIEKTGQTPVTVSYHDHDVTNLTVDSDMNISVGPRGVQARASAKSDKDGDHKDQAFISVYPKGPVVLGGTLASVARALDALDLDATAGEGKLAPLLPRVEGSWLTVWASEIPGDESRSDLPGPLKSLKSFWLSAGETGEAAFVRVKVESSSDEEAMRLNTMAGGLLMLAGSASDDATIKALVQAVHLSAKGPTVELEWAWPIARLGELKALAEKSKGGEGHGGIKIQVQGSADEVPTTRRAR